MPNKPIFLCIKAAREKGTAANGNMIGVPWYAHHKSSEMFQHMTGITCEGKDVGCKITLYMLLGCDRETWLLHKSMPEIV
jgi:hypothetical protein